MIPFACLLLTCIGFAAICWQAGGTLVAPANQGIGTPPAHLHLHSDVLSSQAERSVAIWYSDRSDLQNAVVLIHGLRGDRRKVLNRAERCLNAGLNVVLADLQAHGESPGRLITIGYQERHSVAAAVDFAQQRYPGQQVGIIGVSLGGAAALLASPLPVSVMVLESVYPTIQEAVSNRLAVRMGSWARVLTWALLCQIRPRLGFAASELRPIEHISRVNCPVLLAIGSEDRHTTETEARRMYDAARVPKEFVVFPGAGHTDLLAHNPLLYDNQVIPFLVSQLSQTPP
jgi:uncharacterized protein